MNFTWILRVLLSPLPLGDARTFERIAYIRSHRSTEPPNHLYLPGSIAICVGRGKYKKRPKKWWSTSSWIDITRLKNATGTDRNSKSRNCQNEACNHFSILEWNRWVFAWAIFKASPEKRVICVGGENPERRPLHFQEETVTIYGSYGDLQNERLLQLK